MKRITVIAISLMFALVLITSCANQNVQIGGQHQENVQIAGGNRTVANDEDNAVVEQQQQNNGIIQNEASPEKSNINIWIFALLLPICVVGIWVIYIIVKVYKNRRHP